MLLMLQLKLLLKTLTQMLLEQVQANPGKTVLEFTIYDHTNNVKIKLNSKKYRVTTSAEFMNFLINNEFNYFINI